ncbi:MAG: adenosylcobinamide kinase/adenosylcobinamide-phosphate guanylyltransferase [Ruminococcaceae bacterium]|jgi:adenosylcobinamide kinase/adenosylcobinamide-phosphate guanylyltransferase|nr:adenosylcobinamide kinase/adenosylcobinamide-phosphate guanylyltransferase [Oscillospiraceae bacterium]
MNVFISGGCKNGKSMFAQQIAKKFGTPLYYIATMIPYDEEDEKRIRRHQKEREGWGFETIECPTNILNVLDGRNGTFLLDSVTALLLNEMYENASGEADFIAVERVAKELTEFIHKADNVVLVSDYIYSDAEKFLEFTENYRKALAFIDKTLAKECDLVVEVCVGNKIYHKGEMWE